MLNGLHQMDEHFRTAPFERNLPVFMVLLSLLYSNIIGVQTMAVIPYEQYLKRFPAYLLQLTMAKWQTCHARGYIGSLSNRTILLGESRVSMVSIPSTN